MRFTAILLFASLALAKFHTIQLYNGTQVKLWPHAQDMGVKMGCKHTGADIVSCIKNVVDADQDDRVTAAEIDAAKSKYMHWYEKAFSFVLKRGNSELIVQRCDTDGDAQISIDDLLHWNRACQQYSTEKQVEEAGDTCMCNCEAIDSISKFICDRAS
jgi:hypothetical protein